MRYVLIIVIIIFSIIALWFGSSALTSSQVYEEHRSAVENAVRLAENRLEQANEFFVDYREYLDVLAGSENFHARGAIFLENSIISTYDETMWNWWDDIPWITQSEMDTLFSLFLAEIPGSNIISLIYYENTMTYTLFATPLHLARGGDEHRAWVGFRYGDPTSAWTDVQVVYSEELADNWHLVITSEISRNETTMNVILALIAVVLAGASIGVLVWGVKTYRFLSDPGGVILPIIILAVAAFGLLIVASLFLVGQQGLMGMW